MNNIPSKQAVFLLKVRTSQGKQYARLLIDSLRAFGGEMSGNPIWLFEADPQNAPCGEFESMGVRVIPLAVPEVIKDYIFGDKVFACARAEELANGDIRSLIWMDLSCLVVNPPLLYALDETCEAAVRPVHIRNVGLPSSEALDVYWKNVYKTVGVDDVETTVESFVDRQQLRTYFNAHAFTINPARGLLRRWLEYFERLVSDKAFQASACQDETHQIFLFQAVLSTLLATALDPQRIRILPPVYNYPYNLQKSIPAERRAKALNGLVSFTFEGRSLKLKEMDDIEIAEPLRSWLAERTTSLGIT